MISFFLAGRWVGPLSRLGLCALWAGTGQMVARGSGHVIETVLTTEDSVPGGGASGGVWNRAIPGMEFFAPVINDSGEVAFLGSVRDSAPYIALFANVGGTVRQVAGEGEQLAGMKQGESLGLLKRPNLNNRGQIAFRGYAATTIGASHTCWWLASAGGTELIMRNNEPAPGFSGNFLEGTLPVVAVNPAGVVAVNASVYETNGPIQGIASVWRGEPGSLRPLLRFNQPAPGTSEGFGSAEGGSGTVIASNQTVLFVANLQSSFGTGELAYGLWLDTGTNLDALLVPHQALPEAGPNLSFGTYVFAGHPDVNSRGQFVTTGYLEGPGVGTTNRWCLLAGEVGSRRLLARAGDPVPNLGGVTYVRFLRPVISSGGRIAAWAILPAVGQTNHTALCIDRGNGVELPFRTTIQAPGLPAGTTLIGTSAGPFINSGGQVLVIARLEGPGIDPARNKAFWLVEADLSVHLVAWPGMTIPLPDGGTITLDDVGYGSELAANSSGNDDGTARMLNDRGEFVFVGAWQSMGMSQTGVFVARQERPGLQIKPAGGDTLELSFATRAGWTYQIQWRATLSAGTWADLGETISGSGELALMSLSIDSAAGGRFFRVVARH